MAGLKKMTKIFEEAIQIRFAHCDPAGIVYHPHFFTLFNGVVEDFLEKVIDHPFMHIIKEGYGFPVVGVAADFIHPVKAGDNAIAKLWIEKLGKSSVHFAMTLEVNGILCVKLHEVSAFIKREEKFTPIEIPAWFLDKAKAYVADETSEPLTLRAH